MIQEKKKSHQKKITYANPFNKGLIEGKKQEKSETPKKKLEDKKKIKQDHDVNKEFHQFKDQQKELIENMQREILMLRKLVLENSKSITEV